MFKASVAACVSAPDVPVKSTVAAPEPALDAAVSVTFCDAPGVRLKVAGDALAPAGNPLVFTAIEPVNPFRAAAVTDTVSLVPPAVRVRLPSLTVSEKSGAATLLGVPPPLPQPEAMQSTTGTRKAQSRN